MRIRAHRQQHRLVWMFPIKQFLQLPELFDAPRSPVPAIKHEDHPLFRTKAGQGHWSAIYIFKCKIRRSVTHLQPVQVVGRKICTIFGSQ